MLPKVTSWKPCNVRVSEFPQVIGVASEVTGKRVMGIRGKGACHTALYLPTSKMLVYACFIGQRDPIGVKKAMRECEKGYARVGGGWGRERGARAKVVLVRWSRVVPMWGFSRFCFREVGLFCEIPVSVDFREYRVFLGSARKQRRRY